MNVHYSNKFKKQYRKLPKKIREKFKAKLIVFVGGQKLSQLNMHKLSGEYDNMWSLNVTGDIRAVF